MGRQFLNCEINTCLIVFLTIQELSKAQGNNTDINNTEYSNTDLILSFRRNRELINSMNIKVREIRK